MSDKSPSQAAVKLGAMRLLAIGIVIVSLMDRNWVLFAGGVPFLIFVFRVKVK